MTLPFLLGYHYEFSSFMICCFSFLSLSIGSNNSDLSSLHGLSYSPRYFLSLLYINSAMAGMASIFLL